MTWTTKHCDPAISPKCPGHESWERFTNCLIAALYHAPDTETGSVDWRIWAGLVIQEQPETIPGEYPVTVPAGTYAMVTENDRGHVRFQTFDTAQAAQDAFDEIESTYGDWLSGNDFREYAITSSTGRIGQ
jgi:hypothetical protein